MSSGQQRSTITHCRSVISSGNTSANCKSSSGPGSASASISSTVGMGRKGSAVATDCGDKSVNTLKTTSSIKDSCTVCSEHEC